jgi:hypothetical protein
MWAAMKGVKDIVGAFQIRHLAPDLVVAVGLLLVTGSSVGPVSPIPVVVVAFWFVVRQGLRCRRAP